MIQVVRSLKEWRQMRKGMDDAGQIGFVPTMGALHAGHASLIARSKSENAITVVSIFVNPTQFNKRDDFEKYPLRPEEDLACAESQGVDFVVFPEYREL